MAKNSLISGSIWDEYSNQVVNRMNNPKHQGEITEERAAELGAKLIVADFGAESCGDALRLYWAVDEDTDKILESKFKSFGLVLQLHHLMLWLNYVLEKQLMKL